MLRIDKKYIRGKNVQSFFNVSTYLTNNTVKMTLYKQATLFTNNTVNKIFLKKHKIHFVCVLFLRLKSRLQN